MENAEVTPGVRLDGVVGVQRADLAGRLRVRALELSIEESTEDEWAAVLHAEVASIRALYRAAERDHAELQTAYRSGALSEGVYFAETAVLLTRLRTVSLLGETVATVVNDSAGGSRELVVDRASALKLAQASRDVVRPGLRRSAARIAVVGVGDPGTGIANQEPAVDDNAEARAFSALDAADGRVEAARLAIECAQEDLAKRDGTIAERRSLSGRSTSSLRQPVR